MTRTHDPWHLRAAARTDMLAVVSDKQEAGDMWAEIRTILVLMHVTAGLVGLLVAPAVLAMRKGGRQHRRWGFVYFWAMMAVCASAVALMAFRPNPFLFGVTVLSGYSALAGVRVLRRKLPGTPADVLDFAAAGAALAGGVLLLALAGASALGWLPGFAAPLAVPAALFGVLLGPGAWKDLRRLRNPPATRSWWWYEHMARMGGSYIALVTAFAVNQVAPRLPYGVAWLSWLVPTLVGAPLLLLWVRRYRRRFEAVRTQGGRSPEPIEVLA